MAFDFLSKVILGKEGGGLNGCGVHLLLGGIEEDFLDVFISSTT